MARGVASKRKGMVTPFLLICLAVPGLGCTPAAAHEVLHVSPRVSAPFATSGDPLLEWINGLKAEKVQDRKRAVKQLAAEGSPAAWRALFGALGDPESEVGDAAQKIAARIADEAVAAQLAGRAGLAHKELPIRLRAAEALGRIKCSLDIALLLAALDDSKPEVAHLCLWSLERLARARQLGGDQERGSAQLEQACRSHRDGLVRASALVARAAMFAVDSKEKQQLALDDFRHLLERCREDRDPRVRCAVAIGARELPAGLVFSLTRPLGADPSMSVRLALIETYEVGACKTAATALIAALETEPLDRVRGEIVAALQRISGLKHRADPRPWRDWLRDMPSDWRPTLMPARPASDQGVGQAAGVAHDGQTSARANFVGLPLVSQRICFAIDFSGSMWTPMPDGRLPKELVDARLRATLESVPSRPEFNGVPFTYESLPWRPKLVPANPANVRTAIADFEKCQARGRGNFFDAAIFALDDPEVDTLVTLTDGVPTGGFHSDLELVVALLIERNRFRRVAFDTVLVDAPAASERRFRQLSEATGGHIVATEKAE